MSKFQDFNLHPHLIRALESCGFTEPTPIQNEAIPVVLSGKDLFASAQTGTGKTAAFVLPAVQKILSAPGKPGYGPRVLVLTPTRELSLQVRDNISQLTRFARLISGSVVGGMPYPPQIRLLRQSCDLLVATPGRLMDHMDSGRVDLSRLEILILDEADRMLDMGFVDAVHTIADASPATRQTLMFSATMDNKVLSMARRLLRDPVRVQLAANHTQHASIEQRAHDADDSAHKQRLLAHYLADPAMVQAVVFTATKRETDRLARALSDQGYASAALHGDMGQGARKRAVDALRRGSIRLLVATDVAARGLDVKGISHVFNFDLPMVAEDYIHRIGRTGRAGATGIAVSLVGPNDRRNLGGIERLTGKKIERTVIEGLEPNFREQRGAPKNFHQRSGRPSSQAPRRFASGNRGEPSAYRSEPSGTRNASPKPATPRISHRPSKPRSTTPRFARS